MVIFYSEILICQNKTDNLVKDIGKNCIHTYVYSFYANKAGVEAWKGELNSGELHPKKG